MIILANYKVLKTALQYSYDPKLIALMMWCSTRWSKFRITSLYRAKTTDSGIHELLRAGDVESWFAKYPESLAVDANKVWIYDPNNPKFKCVLYHDVGQGPHFHLQVHPNTIYRKEVEPNVL